MVLITADNSRRLAGLLLFAVTLMAATNAVFFVFYFFLFCLLSNPSSAATYIFGEGTQGASVTNFSALAPLHIGDTLLFRLRSQRQNVYIFNGRKALGSCNFKEATLLERDNNGCFQWLAARVGVFYFSINKAANGSISHCQMGHKFAVVVRRRMPAKFHSRSARLPPFHAPYPRHHRRKSSNNASSLARAPTISPTSQIFPPCRDGFCSSPSPAPTPLPAVPDSVAGVPPSLVPTLPVVPDSAGGVPSLVPMPSGAQDSYGVPFVTSNPALPLPEGETDSSTIRPLPTSAVEGRVLHWSGTQMLLMVLLLCLSFTL